MNLFTRYWTAQGARRDAAHGVNAKERRVQADLGIAPAELERGSFDHRQALRDAADTSRVEEIREDLRRAEDLTTIVGTPHLYVAGLVVAWMVEFAGAVLVLRALGAPAEHRVLPALALTAALIALTHKTVKDTTAAEPALVREPDKVDGEGMPSGTEGHAETTRPALPWRRYLMPAVYTVLVLAIAAMRLVGVEGEDTSLIVVLGEAVLMIAISVGPAFVATWLESRRAPAWELHRRLVTLRRRLRAEEKRVRAAEGRLRDLDRREMQWQQENVQRRNLYALEHELATAEARAAELPAPRGTAPDSSDRKER